MTDNELPDIEKIISLLPGNVYWKDRSGIYRGCNDNAFKLVRLKSREDFIGKTLYDFSEKDIAEESEKNDERIMSTGIAERVEEKAFDSSGNTAIYLSHKLPLRNAKNEVIGLLGISIDITNRKRYEDILKNRNQNDEYPTSDEIIALLPGNVYWKDRKGVYLGCNDHAAKLIQLNSRHDVVGKSLYDIAPQNIAEQIIAVDDAIMESGEESCTEEAAFDLQGNPATYFTRKVPLKNTHGKVIGLAGISIDITERKRYENELKIAKEKAEVANKAKSDFIRNMSHDIRTPFSGILGLSQLLSDKEPDLEKKEMLDCIVDSAENLLHILNEVIYLTTLDKKSAPDTQAFNIKALVEEIYKIMLPETKRKNLDFKLRIKSDVPVDVIGDQYSTKRILLNLVGNAIKFTDTGSISISVTTLAINDGATMIQFSVSDTGIGIPEDKLEVIFEQFSRLSDAHEGRYQGSGLGLWLVKQLTQRIGGKIEIESELGKGSTFTSTLPLTIGEKETV